ncbi:unnamed protein product [Anisakis simplex]|uniref:Myeloid leukemia factor (inferred by orthology to a D. melanogaster protein) n=1 Tax=Anisakis simplex TaxID=6269 RepID=A0A0M3JR13_ANISI|nr:unnamed protein product [Anisakis simplex]
MLENATARQRPQYPDDMALMNPFGGFGGNLFGGIMRQMEDVQSNIMSDPNAHVYSHSTMITYDGRNGDQPRIVEKSIRKAGDIRETRESLRRGNVGERMSIEHTIGDRTHVIEKKRDREGRIREEQRFVNLDQGEAEDFDREFSTRVRHNLGGDSSVRVRQAIEANPRSTSHTSSRTNHTVNSNFIFSKASNTTRPSGSEAAPVITLVDEEEDEISNSSGSSPQQANAHSSRKHGGSRSRSSGPIIREISEEEAEMSVSKRRKGLGRFFKANDD